MSLCQASEAMQLIQKSFNVAQEVKADPFMIKRQMAATPDIITPLFAKHGIEREKLASKSVIGQGQVC